MVLKVVFSPILNMFLSSASCVLWIWLNSPLQIHFQNGPNSLNQDSSFLYLWRGLPLLNVNHSIWHARSGAAHWKNLFNERSTFKDQGPFQLPSFPLLVTLVALQPSDRASFISSFFFFHSIPSQRVSGPRCAGEWEALRREPSAGQFHLLPVRGGIC